MDPNNIIQIISTVGFPIVACGALAWYVVQISNQHREESNSLREAINKLELAITTLIERIKEQ